MLNTKKLVLSWLLHHANRYYKSEYFYSLKKELLAKYGSHLGYDVQFIEGKKCWSCDGTGTYAGHHYYSGIITKEPCYNCYSGWYKRHEWNILEVIQFGKYTFHQPWKRVNEKPTIAIRHNIEGYISHKSSYWSLFSRCVLYFIYRRADYGDKWTLKLKRNAYRVYWFKHFPYNFLSNLISSIYQGKESYFYRYKLKPFFVKYLLYKKSIKFEGILEDDLPF
jgi:hypothetical protein